MADVRHREEKKCYRSEVVFLSTACFQTTFNKKGKIEDESGSEASKLFTSSAKPLHLKRNSSNTSLQNTYRTGLSGCFPAAEISRFVGDILKNRLQNESYEENRCRCLSKDICNVIQEEIKKLYIPRYKSVCYVHIGQIKGQDMVIASRCLWDTTVDNFAQAQYKNSSLFASASVFGIYYE